MLTSQRGCRPRASISVYLPLSKEELAEGPYPSYSAPYHTMPHHHALYPHPRRHPPVVQSVSQSVLVTPPWAQTATPCPGHPWGPHAHLRCTAVKHT